MHAMDDAHRSRRRSVLRPLTRTRAIVFGALAASLVVLAVLFQWNWLRGPVERLVAWQTGRSFDIAGDLDVDLGRVTTIRADALRFGNADWSPSRTMASADRAELDVRLWPLLSGEIRLEAIRLTRPRLRLEFGPDGRGNWIFGERGGESRVRYTGLWGDDGRLVFLDPRRRTNFDIALDSVSTGDASASPVDLEGKGRWAGNAFTIAGRVESPLALRQTDRPYRIDLRATAGPTRAHARGTLLDPFRLRDFDLRLRLAGQDMEDLFPLIGIATPPTPPYRLDGRFLAARLRRMRACCPTQRTT